MKRSAIAAALAALLAPAALFAGAEGRVLGRVVDQEGKPVEGVKITITSPAVRTFKVELTTNKDGKFEKLFIDAVPKYHYKFEKQGFATLEDDFKIKAGDMSASYEVKMTSGAQAAAAGGAPAQQQVDPFVAAYNEAVEKYQAGDLETAMTKVEEATKAGPDKANGYDLAARIAYKKKDWDKVIANGEKTLQLDSDNPEIMGVLVEAYRTKGNKEKTKEWEAKYMAANPDKPGVVLNQAIELFNKGNFKGAESLLKKVVEAEPGNAKAHYLLGMSYANLGKIAEMRTHLNEYLKLEPSGKDAGAAKEMLDAYKGM